jgi:hypothetical protein
VGNLWLIFLVLAYAALFWWTIQVGLFGIFFVALLGTVLTVGLTTGSLAPLYPTASRTTHPLKYWTVMIACGAIVALNIINLIWRT